MLSLLIHGARQLGVDLGAEQLDLFERYYRLLKAAGPRVRVTSVTGYEAVQQRHFLESLALLPALLEAGLLADRGRERVLDLGAGAGLPGLPLRIAAPGLRLTLLEATGRKAAFLGEVVAELALDQVEVLTGRAEDVARQADRWEAYDLVVARAVAPLPTLLELALPFLRLGGALAAPKGSSVPREVSRSERALDILGGRLLSVAPVDVPGAKHAPRLVLVSKVAPTPDAYPRRSGIPAKRPL
ncbi:MAG: 16S rRNA (guanine(527)-N(7))-methyltransferase RsmG [Promethearchaeota archaeon]